MTYKELADLIFPNEKKVEYYEEKYPKRELKERSNSYEICSKSNRIYAYRKFISSNSCNNGIKKNKWNIFP